MTDIRKLNISIYRFNPDTDAKPTMRDYQLEIPLKSDPMILTILERLRDEQDASITYRRSCREGVCGSDGMNINGKNALACITILSDLKTNKIVLRPLPGFPVIRDLAIDISQFYQQY